MNNKTQKKITLSLFGMEADRDDFFLIITILNLVLTFFTIIFAVPAIVCLCLYCSEKNFKHGFFNCFSVYNLVLAFISIIISGILILLLLFGLIFGDDIFKIVLLFYIIFYGLGFVFSIWYLIVSFTFYKEYDIYCEENKNEKQNVNFVDQELVEPEIEDLEQGDEISKKIDKNELFSKQVSEVGVSIGKEVGEEIKEDVIGENVIDEDEENKIEDKKD